MVSFSLGWVIGNWNAIKTFSRILHKLGVTDQQLRRLNEEPRDTAASEPGVVHIKIEQMGESLYAYTVDNDTFLAQGSTAEDLVKGILNRLPKGSRVICSRDQGGELIESALK
jgi:uncharacterized protein YfcZ (UPF0381/DUF406 family)